MQQNYKVKVKESKCYLFIEMVNFLDYVIDAKGVHIDQWKVDVIM